MNKKIILLITALISYLLIIFSNTYMHEQAHQQIAEYYGLQSEIHFDILKMRAYTTVFNQSSLPIEEQRDITYMDSMNEVIGYNNDGIMNMLLLLIIIIIITSSEGEKNDKSTKRNSRERISGLEEEGNTSSSESRTIKSVQGGVQVQSKGISEEIRNESLNPPGLGTVHEDNRERI